MQNMHGQVGRKNKTKTIIEILCLAEYDPHKLFWKYLEEVRQIGIENNKRKTNLEKKGNNLNTSKIFRIPSMHAKY